MKYNQQKIIEEFNHFAPVYDETITADMQYTAHQIIPEQIIKYFSDNLSMATVLDLGCGTGISSQILLKKECQITGVDISGKMIEQATHNGLHKTVCQNIETDWNFANGGNYHIILALGVMDFIQRPPQFLQQIFTHLNPNGIVGITVPLNLPKEKNSLGMNSFSHSEAKGLFKQNGFKIIWTQQFLGYILDIGNRVEYQGYLLQKQ